MTKINQDELAQIEYVDQALMWCVIELEHANHHPENLYLSDNASVRAEAVDFVSWAVIQDESGNGQFVYNALLPLYNPHPLLQQQSIIECVKSYTVFQLPGEQITYPVGGKGMLLPTIPTYIDTMEKLLFWLVQIVEGVNRYIKLINDLIGAEFVETATAPTPTVSIDDGVVSITGLEAVAPILETQSSSPTTAEGIISQYESSGYDPNAVPDWYMNYVDNLSNSSGGDSGTSGGGGEPKPVDPGSGNNSGNIDTLPVCKEQDPKIVSFSKDGILNFVNG
jgi:hypothetical protein